ncbi:NmrA domain-containing protein [Mycena venus]|uniref:NmrA domain-containing protein n=1 Tax=Mycena venus TaxID=2733690 RepID=A0A8H6Y4H2_9AGAR|nr:NmrA domain-containing protein [Mycena venus]
MTISKEPSAPLVAVVGATGTQGGSVINALAQSDKAYRVRGFTRDAVKPSAQELIKLGIEIFVVSLVVENKEEVYKAFAGADVAFLVTNFWEHLDMEREIREGKLLIDAAKAGGVSRIVWSGLPSFNKLSGGKYVNVYHFDGKAIVTEYGRQSGVPFVDLQAGFYGTNFLTSPTMPVKQAQSDGSDAFVMPWPVKPTMRVPFIDAVHDYGLFVRHVLELPVFPDGSEIVAHGEKITLADIAKQLSQVTGKNVIFQQISVEQFKAGIQGQLPPHIVLDMTEFVQSWDEFGWGETAPIQESLARRPRTWIEFVENTDWSKALA